MNFSNDGSHLLSVAFDSLFSIEIFDTENYFSVGFINSGNFPIFDVKFFYSNLKNFVTIGYRNISIWKIKGRSIRK